MKNILRSLSVIAGISMLFAIPSSSMAGNVQFNRSISYGTEHSSEVTQLQQFLINNGYLNAQATGNYLSATKAAVQAFQKAHNIQTTGNFGPLTMAAANAAVQTVASSGPATVALQSVSPTTGTASVIGGAKTITWQTSAYPSGVGVNINLIQKTSSAPVSYNLVQQLAQNAANTGSFSWVPTASETSGNLYIEVTCSNSVQLSAGCQTITQPISVNS